MTKYNFKYNLILRTDRQIEKEKEREAEEAKHAAGSHHRELNPFWKNGGTGMPPTKEEFRKQREEERDSNRKMQKTRERPKEREMPVMSGVDLEMDAMWAEREEETAQPVAKKQKFTGALSVTK